MKKCFLIMLFLVQLFAITSCDSELFNKKYRYYYISSTDEIINYANNGYSLKINKEYARLSNEEMYNTYHTYCHDSYFMINLDNEKDIVDDVMYAIVNYPETTDLKTVNYPFAIYKPTSNDHGLFFITITYSNPRFQQDFPLKFEEFEEDNLKIDSGELFAKEGNLKYKDYLDYYINDDEEIIIDSRTHKDFLPDNSYFYDKSIEARAKTVHNKTYGLYYTNLELEEIPKELKGSYAILINFYYMDVKESDFYYENGYMVQAKEVLEKERIILYRLLEKISLYKFPKN